MAYCSTITEIDHYQQIVTRLSKLCRICGDPFQDGVNIFGNKSVNQEIKEKIEVHMPIKIVPDDMMPQNLCMDCYQKLEAVHNLVVTCLKSDMRFRRYLNLDMNSHYDAKFSKIANGCLEVMKELPSRRDCNRPEAVYPSTTVISGLNKSSVPEGTSRNESSNEPLDETEFQDVLTDAYYKMKYDAVNEFQMRSDDKMVSVDETESIVCLNCRASFKSTESFEEHKMLCKPVEWNEQNEEIEKTLCNTPDSFIEEKECTNILKMNQEVQKKIRCGHCKKDFMSRKMLQIHLNATHGGTSLYMCGICDKIYKNWAGLDVHEATHSTDKPFLCDLCGKKFKHSNNLRGHKRIHLDESKKKKYICDICQARFRSRFHLQEHLNSHNKNKPYSCEHCGKSFFKRVQLRQHKLTHGSKKYTCSVCTMSFNRRGNMMAHMKRHNKGDTAYKCAVCETRCKTMSELKVHRKQHTEKDIADVIREKMNNKPLLQCKVCSKMFLKQSLLSYHERTHTQNKSTICDECGKELASRHTLAAHKKAVHSNDKSHLCQHCGNSFASKEARLTHERTHTGERPYECEICHARYKCSSNLGQHMKTHANKYPHICSYCDKGFTRKGSLTIHERTHTGVKPYSCINCDQAFVQKNDLTKHLKSRCKKSPDVDESARKDQRENQVEHLPVIKPLVHSYVVVPQILNSYMLNIVPPDQITVIQTSN